MFLVSLRSKVGGCRTGQHRPESESKESKATKMLHLCHSYDLNIFEFMSFIWIHLPYLAHLCVCFVSCLLGTIEIKAGLSRIHLFLSVTDLDHVASTRSVIVFEILRILRILRWVYLSVPCQVFRSKPQTDPKQSLPMVAVLVRFGRFGWGILRLEPGIGFMEPFAHVGMTSRQLAPLLLWRMVMDLVGWCCEVAWFWYTLNKALLCYTIKVPAKVPFITEIQWVSRTTWEFHDLTFHFLVVLWLFSPSLVFVFHFGHSWPRREAIKESLCANLLRLRGTGFLTVSHDFTCKKVFWCFVPFWSFCTPRPTSTIGIDLKPWRRSRRKYVSEWQRRRLGKYQVTSPCGGPVFFCSPRFAQKGLPVVDQDNVKVHLAMMHCLLCSICAQMHWRNSEHPTACHQLLLQLSNWHAYPVLEEL